MEEILELNLDNQDEFRHPKGIPLTDEEYEQWNGEESKPVSINLISSHLISSHRFCANLVSSYLLFSIWHNHIPIITNFSCPYKLTEMMLMIADASAVYTWVLDVVSKKMRLDDIFSRTRT